MKLGEEVVKHRFEEALLKHPSPLEYEPVTTQKTTSDIYCCMFKYETLWDTIPCQTPFPFKQLLLSEALQSRSFRLVETMPRRTYEARQPWGGKW